MNSLSDPRFGRAVREVSGRRPVPWRRPVAAWVLGVSMGCTALAASPSPAAGGAGVTADNALHLSSAASVEVVQDTLTITLQATRDGASAASVQAGLKQVMNDALSQARAAAQAPALEVRTGQFMLNPRYQDNGRIAGWIGQAQLVLTGTDPERVARVAGELGKLQMLGMHYSVSRGVQEQNERALTEQALANFRSRAEVAAKALGASGFQVHEVRVESISDGGGGPRPMVMAMRAKVADEAAPIPAEAGKSVLSVQVQGSVRLKP